MDFIEQIFGIAPNGGSSPLEMLLFAVLLTGLATLYLCRRARSMRPLSRKEPLHQH